MKVMVDGEARDMRSVRYDSDDNIVYYIDQRKLPRSVEIYSASTVEENVFAIKDMVVRGAPAIGIAAAWALCQARAAGKDIGKSAELLRKTRPTARDLFHAIEQVMVAEAQGKDLYSFCSGYVEDVIDRCRRIGEVGEPLVKDGFTVLTHCNAGALATGDWGTALAPIRLAHRNGKNIHVLVDETRPWLQGSRLTAWELLMEGIPHSIIADNAAGYYMARGEVDLVITGADRITSEGYVANKIGTYEKAVVARYNKIPFYVAAPVTSFDPAIRTGEEIPIEMRDEREITEMGGVRIAPQGSEALNPAFDVTPPGLITGYVTEGGVMGVKEIYLENTWPYRRLEK